MATILTCGKCNKDYDVSRLKPGTRLKCKGCASLLTVPDDNVITCVNCSQIFRASGVAPGTKFKCNKCNTLMQIGKDGKPLQISEKQTVRLKLKSTSNEAVPATPFSDADYKPKNRAQEITPPPSARRFDLSNDESELDDIFEKENILGAFLLDDDGILFAAHCRRRFDSELVSNSAVFLRKISSFLKEDFGFKENGVLSLSMKEGEMRLRSMQGKTLALLLRNGSYNGKHDASIAKSLETAE